eukprot:TRINITY_DN533_c0_g1_i1.p1 TRINITY_DN533_c0_g1~~TRINITY_DN533_c0_g1_i1.p1  ORF type:complete len:106 (+),score=24.57 TRINITY_DN533_c0_g1_i1:29-346(+)
MKAAAKRIAAQIVKPLKVLFRPVNRFVVTPIKNFFVVPYDPKPKLRKLGWAEEEIAKMHPERALHYSDKYITRRVAEKKGDLGKLEKDMKKPFEELHATATIQHH